MSSIVDSRSFKTIKVANVINVSIFVLGPVMATSMVGWHGVFLLPKHKSLVHGKTSFLQEQCVLNLKSRKLSFEATIISQKGNNKYSYSLGNIAKHLEDLKVLMRSPDLL